MMNAHLARGLRELADAIDTELKRQDAKPPDDAIANVLLLEIAGDAAELAIQVRNEDHELARETAHRLAIQLAQLGLWNGDPL